MVSASPVIKIIKPLVTLGNFKIYLLRFTICATCKSRDGESGERNEGNDENAGNQDGNAGKPGGSAGNQGKNAGYQGDSS